MNQTIAVALIECVLHLLDAIVLVIGLICTVLLTKAETF